MPYISKFSDRITGITGVCECVCVCVCVCVGDASPLHSSLLWEEAAGNRRVVRATLWPDAKMRCFRIGQHRSEEPRATLCGRKWFYECEQAVNRYDGKGILEVIEGGGGGREGVNAGAVVRWESFCFKRYEYIFSICQIASHNHLPFVSLLHCCAEEPFPTIPAGCSVSPFHHLSVGIPVSLVASSERKLGRGESGGVRVMFLVSCFHHTLPRGRKDCVQRFQLSSSIHITLAARREGRREGRQSVRSIPAGAI